MDFIGLAFDIGSNTLDAGMSVGKVVAKASPTDRKCSVTISNNCSSYTLCNPRVRIESGKCSDPLPPTIEANSSGSGLFTKTASTARGAVGVFTYDLHNNSTNKSTGTMAIMYKVPFDLNLKAVAYAVGVVDLGTECNKELFRQMSKLTGPPFSREKAKGPSITHTSDFVTVRANMSDCYTPVMKIEVSENSTICKGVKASLHES